MDWELKVLKVPLGHAEHLMLPFSEIFPAGQLSQNPLFENVPSGQVVQFFMLEVPKGQHLGQKYPVLPPSMAYGLMDGGTVLDLTKSDTNSSEELVMTDGRSL